MDAKLPLNPAVIRSGKLAHAVREQRLPDSTPLVELVTEGAFFLNSALKHAGSIYTSIRRIDPSSEAASARLVRAEMRPNWCRVAD